MGLQLPKGYCHVDGRQCGLQGTPACNDCKVSLHKVDNSICDCKKCIASNKMICDCSICVK